MIIVLCAGVNSGLAQTTKKKSNFDKIFKPTPTATPSTSSDTTSATTSDDKKTDKNSSGKISVKDDEFTGKRKVVLENLALAVDLTVSLTSEVDLKLLNDNQRPDAPRPDHMFSTSIADTVLNFIVAHPGKTLFLDENNRFDFVVDGARAWREISQLLRSMRQYLLASKKWSA